jgi:hypothetical protein
VARNFSRGGQLKFLFGKNLRRGDFKGFFSKTLPKLRNFSVEEGNCLPILPLATRLVLHLCIKPYITYSVNLKVCNGLEFVILFYLDLGSSTYSALILSKFKYKIIIL